MNSRPLRSTKLCIFLEITQVGESTDFEKINKALDGMWKWDLTSESGKQLNLEGCCIPHPTLAQKPEIIVALMAYQVYYNTSGKFGSIRATVEEDIDSADKYKRSFYFNYAQLEGANLPILKAVDKRFFQLSKELVA